MYTHLFQLEKHRSPVLRDFMVCLQELMKDYKTEIKGCCSFKHLFYFATIIDLWYFKQDCGHDMYNVFDNVLVPADKFFTYSCFCRSASHGQTACQWNWVRPAQVRRRSASQKRKPAENCYCKIHNEESFLLYCLQSVKSIKPNVPHGKT
jgi:hypothetical protein